MASLCYYHKVNDTCSKAVVKIPHMNAIYFPFNFLLHIFCCTLPRTVLSPLGLEHTCFNSVQIISKLCINEQKCFWAKKGECPRFVMSLWSTNSKEATEGHGEGAAKKAGALFGHPPRLPCKKSPPRNDRLFALRQAATFSNKLTSISFIWYLSVPWRRKKPRLLMTRLRRE